MVGRMRVLSEILHSFAAGCRWQYPNRLLRPCAPVAGQKSVVTSLDSTNVFDSVVQLNTLELWPAGRKRPSIGCDPRAPTAVWRRQLRRRTCPSVKTPARERTVTRSSLDTGGSPGGSIREPFGLGGTRLKRIIQNGSNSVAVKFNKSRKKFPSKILLLLLGYYSANALATVLGQTGDWDILAAGVMVAIIEGVGYLLYRMPPFLGERGKEVVALANYYKLGFSFGLFVDAFKLGS